MSGCGVAVGWMLSGFRVDVGWVWGGCWVDCLSVGCLTSQQYASASRGQICSDNCTCYHTEIEVADQTLSHSQSTLTRPTSPSADPSKPGA